MTCIIGYRDPKNGVVYIGADSCGGNTALARKFIRRDKKVFKLRDDDNTLIGFAGSFRMGQLLMTAEGLLDRPIEKEIKCVYDENCNGDNCECKCHNGTKIETEKINDVNLESMIDTFIPNTISLLLDGGYAVQTENGLEGGIFLVANKDKLFKIDGDFQVGEYEDDFIAIGSGETFAYGALEALKDKKISIPNKILTALRTASKYAMGVEPPFIIMNTLNDEILKFDK